MEGLLLFSSLTISDTLMADGRWRKTEEEISKYSFLLSSTLTKFTWSCWDRI